MAAAVSLFGIRHHGPGSARRLLDALDALRPAAVLIEGPADASHLLPMLADPSLTTPVALLTYPEDDPSRASFFPFADYSPEFQAARWAVAHGAELRFIDLPACDRLAGDDEGAEATGGEAEAAASDEGEAEAAPDLAAAPIAPEPDPVARDPIGALASAAGYADGESWWSDVIEHNPESVPVFAAVADAMAALREGEQPLDAREAAREAHMRLEIANAAKTVDGPVAVVCGAWHVPALAARVSQAADRATLKGRRKVRTKATWVPWTAPRLARASGYGAGVVAPGWWQHLWDNGHDANCASAWLARVARVMRERGHFVSTASVIEAQRMGVALAALRDRPQPGFEELREAAIACLAGGERTVWDDIAAELLIGTAVGSIPAATPLAPLLEDLARQQKAVRLKPEALERALTLDLRSDSGLARSTLLHRLNTLGVAWGKLADAGRSRGTFRENWLLAWEPEYAVRLVENLVYGPTIAGAASGRLLHEMQAQTDLGQLAALVRGAMVADLPDASEAGIALLEARAALTSDTLALLTALPPMADVVRYGEARAGTLEHMAALMPRIVVQAALGFPHGARDLDIEAAQRLRTAIVAADRAIALAELAPETGAQWYDALGAVVADTRAARLVAGAAARLLYEAERLAAGDAATLLSRMLSPGTPVTDAAGFFEGFFEGAGQRLIHDSGLREAVDGWLLGLEEEAFVESLPLLRRVFSQLDKTERRRLLDAVLGREAAAASGYRLLPGAAAIWPEHEARIMRLFANGAQP